MAREKQHHTEDRIVAYNSGVAISSGAQWEIRGKKLSGTVQVSKVLAYFMTTPAGTVITKALSDTPARVLIDGADHPITKTSWFTLNPYSLSGDGETYRLTHWYSTTDWSERTLAGNSVEATVFCWPLYKNASGQTGYLSNKAWDCARNTTSPDGVFRNAYGITANGGSIGMRADWQYGLELAGRSDCTAAFGQELEYTNYGISVLVLPQTEDLPTYAPRPTTPNVPTSVVFAKRTSDPAIRSLRAE